MLDHIRSTLASKKIEGKVIYVLALVLLAQFIYPITESGSLPLLLVYQGIYALLILAGIIIAWDRPRLRQLLYVVGPVWLVMAVVFTLNQTAFWANVTGYIAYSIFLLTVTWILFQYILETRRITRDVIYAAIAIYLLLGAVFVPVYGLIDTLTFWLSGGAQHAFSGGVNPVTVAFAWQDFIYYSYVTLTTLGYGDILPVTMLAKVAVSVEAIIGVLYLTIVMARLVSLYSAEFDRGSTE